MLTPERIDAVAPLLYGPEVNLNREAFDRFLRARGRPSALGYYGQLARVAGWSSLPWLHRLRMPALVMAGRHDRVVPPINARELAWLMPNARLRWADGGHLFLMLNPAWSAAVIREFLD
jgi:pimeloyl-ACP methyl ester carboxylesterase